MILFSFEDSLSVLEENKMNVKMPVLFVGHGSPMNAVENNEFTRGWEEIVEKITEQQY